MNCREYTVTVTVPANTLQEDSGDVSGIYKFVVSVFLNSNLGSPGSTSPGSVRPDPQDGGPELTNGSDAPPGRPA